LVDVFSVGLEKVFAVLQPGIFGDRFTDFTSNVKSVKENAGITGIQGRFTENTFDVKSVG